jgi:hypothetical protein
MPMVVVNGSDFVRQVLIRLPIASADIRIEACHGDYPHRSPEPPETLQETDRRVQRRAVP